MEVLVQERSFATIEVSALDDLHKKTITKVILSKIKKFIFMNAVANRYSIKCNFIMYIIKSQWFHIYHFAIHDIIQSVAHKIQ